MSNEFKWDDFIVGRAVIVKSRFQILAPITSFPSNIVTLCISGNSLEKVPCFPETLVNIDLSNNRIWDIPRLGERLRFLDLRNNNNDLRFFENRLPDSLVELNVSGNLMTSLPIIGPNLVKLNFSRNFVKSAYGLPRSLRFIDGSNNRLCILDLEGNNNIEILKCNNNLISNIEIPERARLVCLNNNMITKIKYVPMTIEEFDISHNRLVSIPPITGDLLFTVDISHNKLTEIPALSDSIRHLHINNNRISGVLELPSKLVILNAGSNKISEIPEFPAGIRNINVSDNNIRRFPAAPSSCAIVEAHGNPIMNFWNIPRGTTYVSIDINMFGSTVKIRNVGKGRAEIKRRNAHYALYMVTKHLLGARVPRDLIRILVSVFIRYDLV